MMYIILWQKPLKPTALWVKTKQGAAQSFEGDGSEQSRYGPSVASGSDASAADWDARLGNSRGP